MSYPPPPGLSSYSAPSSKPSNLPARPPPSKVPAAGFKPAYPAAAPSYGAPGYQSAGFVPRQLGGPPAAPAYSVAPAYGAAPAYPAYPAQPAYAGADYYGGHAAVDPYAQAAPQIRNPFAPPSATPSGPSRYDAALVDPEYEAQIAQWQSAYSKDAAPVNQYGNKPTYATNPNAPTTSVNSAPLGGGKDLSGPAISAAAQPDTGVASVVGGKDDAKPTVVRTGGGTQWTDSSLLEWDPSHFRIFVGNLAGEVTDESLLKAFSRWPSVQKARVVRDKRTTKSKGFGFVSFSDGDEFFQAAKEMQGKYIGSHPVKISRSTTEIKPVVPKDDRRGKGRYQRKGNHHDRDQKGKGGGHGVKEGGVQKAGQKTKGGLKILG